MESIEALHGRILSCRMCQDAGYIELAAPVVSGRRSDRIMLIGQAPGITELGARRPFHGRAGRELFRWMHSIGIEEDEFRSRVYMTSVTKCYPGRVTCGSGDRRPSQQEIALCRPYLEAQLVLVQPQLILPVGTLALERYFPSKPLSDLVGRRFEQSGVALVPLPHPSGASRWLNVPNHRALLQQALSHIRTEWDRVYPDETREGEPKWPAPVSAFAH